MNQSRYFLLGNTPELSMLELETLFPGNITPITNQISRVDFTSTPDEQEMMSIIGGTIKILTAEKAWGKNASEEEVFRQIISYLAQSESKVHFGFHAIGYPEQPFSDRDIKDALKEIDVSSRFIDSSSMGVNSGYLVHHPQYIDLLLVKTEDSITLLKTAATQDIEDWTNRDRNKPYADRKKGMLPPKVARMMTIIGIGKPFTSYSKGDLSKVTVLDPFCGTGTIPMEAAMVGARAIGSDSSQETIEQARENIDWISKEYQLRNKPELYTADATSGKLSDLLSDIDVIVTEPFLGKPKANYRQLPNIYKGLYKLYTGAFRHWRSFLKDGARVAIVFPSVDTGKRTFDLKQLIDKLPNLGYTIASGPIEYARSKAMTRRQIYVFEYKAEKK